MPQAFNFSPFWLSCTFPCLNLFSYSLNFCSFTLHINPVSTNSCLIHWLPGNRNSSFLYKSLFFHWLSSRHAKRTANTRLERFISRQLMTTSERSCMSHSLERFPILPAIRYPNTSFLVVFVWNVQQYKRKCKSRKWTINLLWSFKGETFYCKSHHETGALS